jgi:polar amino acid transport system substrate-binding protein
LFVTLGVFKQVEGEFMDVCWVKFLCVSILCFGFNGDTKAAQANNAVSEDFKPVLNVYLDRETKQLIDAHVKLSEDAVAKLTTFLTRSGLPYRLHFVPWPRALALLEEDNHSLIYQLLKTPERVAQYHWIMPVFEKSNMELYTLQNSVYASQNLEQILAGEGVAVCSRQSAQCDALLRLGFPKNRIEVVTFSSTNVFEQMLLRGRVQFIPSYLAAISANLYDLGYNPETVKSVAFLDSSLDYLAAPKHFDQKLLTQLLKTSQQGLPLLTAEPR